MTRSRGWPNTCLIADDLANSIDVELEQHAAGEGRHLSQERAELTERHSRKADQIGALLPGAPRHSGAD